MNKYFKYLFSLFLSISLLIEMHAQIPTGYYGLVTDQQGEELRLVLHDIIDSHTSVSYDDLWDVYVDTDKRSDGKVWDTYSNCSFTFGSDQCGSYQDICDCYNREHTVPQSWFNEASPMVSDAFHVIPTDGKVNGYRSSFPFGECNSGTTYGLGKLGSCTYAGYSGTVFEPADEYKGDMARIYFYMATRYMDVIDNWSGGASFSGDNLSQWTINMMLEWHHNDPVSQKEIDRNDVVYSYQNNRNPYVDNPIWADAVWDPNYVPNYTDIISVFFAIAPNPASDLLKINLSINDYNSGEIIIYDISGRILFAKTPVSSTEIIDIDEFLPGTYYVVLQLKGRCYYNKLIVIR